MVEKFLKQEIINIVTDAHIKPRKKSTVNVVRNVELVMLGFACDFVHVRVVNISVCIRCQP